MPQNINPNARHPRAKYNVPQIVEDAIREKAHLAYGFSRDKRLLTAGNGKVCRSLVEYFPVDVPLATIERIFSEAWFACQEGI